MTRILIRATLGFLLSAFLCSQALGTTYTASSCSASAVQGAINQATHDGDIVAIPAGNCTWTTTVSVTFSNSVTIQGAGAQTPSGGSDLTIIQDNINRSSQDNPLLQVTTTSGKTFRLTGVAFYYSTSNSSVTYNGSIRIGGSSQAVRVDNCHFNNLNEIAMDIDGWIYGVVDHNLFDMPVNSVYNGVRADELSWNGYGYGDGSWADNSSFGSSQFIFFETNTFNNGFAQDCNGGGRFVFRYNVLNSAAIQGHEMEDRMQGCRAFEVYENTFTTNSPGGPDTGTAAYFRTGTGLFWGNAVNQYPNFITFHNDRSDTGHYFGNANSSCTSSCWGYCGTQVTGTGSGFDQNSNQTTGYACTQQIGRGKGNLLPQQYWPFSSNQFIWYQNALEPVYIWDTTFNPPSNYQPSLVSVFSPSPIVESRDYYVDDGTHGVTSGLLSARPTTCTPLVAYWATDTTTLYQCSTVNTWTAYYAPYTYPHPLTQGGDPPGPPSNLQAIPQ